MFPFWIDIGVSVPVLLQLVAAVSALAAWLATMMLGRYRGT